MDDRPPQREEKRVHLIAIRAGGESERVPRNGREDTALLRVIRGARLADVAAGFFKCVWLGDAAWQGRDGNRVAAFARGLEKDFVMHGEPQLQWVYRFGDAPTDAKLSHRDSNPALAALWQVRNIYLCWSVAM